MIYTKFNKTLYCLQFSNGFFFVGSPLKPYIPTTSFPWLEGQNGKQLDCSSGNYGNPASDVLWFPVVGTANTTKLTFPKLIKSYNGLNISCQLKNTYTERLNRNVKSETIQMNIQCKLILYLIL